MEKQAQSHRVAARGPHQVSYDPRGRKSPAAMQKAAVEYIARGYVVVPLHGVEDGSCTCSKGPECPSAGKHPVRSIWIDRPLRSEEEVAELWRARGSQPTNIGILLQRSDRLLLVDVDKKSMKNGPRVIRTWSTEADIDFDQFLIQDTPSGGWHCLFRVPEGYEGPLPNKAEVAPGIDVFCEDRQFVVAPSCTAVGEYHNATYDLVVLPPIAEVPVAPEWLLERLASSSGRRRSRRSASWAAGRLT